MQKLLLLILIKFSQKLYLSIILLKSRRTFFSISGTAGCSHGRSAAGMINSTAQRTIHSISSIHIVSPLLLKSLLLRESSVSRAIPPSCMYSINSIYSFYHLKPLYLSPLFYFPQQCIYLSSVLFIILIVF